jgi:SAM-dependent methyltransferase
MVAVSVAERGSTQPATSPRPVTFPADRIAAHRQMLEERVFQVESKWPQFRRLLDDMGTLADETPAGAAVVCLERTLLYGGFSLFAPLFSGREFISVDCSPDSADTRGAYNAGMVDDARFVAVPTTRRAPPEATGLPSGSVDLVMVPNLVHHVRDQAGLFAEMARILRPGGRGYIFEPLLRELHQMPDDYVRYTPWGFQQQIEAAGLIYDRFVSEGGPFTAIAYCWTQALEYFPAEKRAEMERWFYDGHFKDLVAWDREYGSENRARKHTSFPTAFGIFFHKD